MLTIVIPALNEEASIEAVCRKCLDCKKVIRDKCGEEIEIIVIDDGSSDKTALIAQSIPSVQVFSFEKNRGYGAALKKGFQLGHGDLLGFLDADGTCDPLFFIPMILAVKEGYSIALGNRLGSNSKMPRIRKIGNKFFAWLIRALSGAQVMDSASGMRVIHRGALPLLYPLPDGLNFTPAMSCRAALDPRLSLKEVPMGYKEREGESKLGVIRDGLRFLKVILEIAILYRPLLLFGFAGTTLLLLGAGYSVTPAIEFIKSGNLPSDRVYRVLSILVFVTGGFAFIYAGALADQVQGLVSPPKKRTGLGGWIRRIFFKHPFILSSICFLAAFLINAKALYQYFNEGVIHSHWATIALGGLISLIGILLLAFGLLQRFLELLTEKAKAELDP